MKLIGLKLGHNLLTQFIFSRINIRDHKRVGISREASEDKTKLARIFLIQRYGGPKQSVDAIKSAHNGALTRRYLDKFCMVFRTY
ncbi:hypothetical protein ACSBR2_039901 [Camellia fascicularis]